MKTPIEIIKSAIRHKTRMPQRDGDCIILKIKNDKVKIQFCSTKAVRWVNKYVVIRGVAKDFYAPRVHGVGFIGEGEFQRKTHTKLYLTWQHMLGRCYNKDIQNNQPRYKGCKVVTKWHNFQNFCADVTKMPNCVKPGFEFDKDLRVKYNKTYGNSYCSFVPRKVNNVISFIKHRDSKIGILNPGKLYHAQGSFGGKRKTSKGFVTKEQAHKEYLRYKKIYLKQVVDKYIDDLHPQVIANLLSL